MSNASVNRREFLETAGRVGAGAVMAAASVESARGYAANDTIEIGCIGTGGRCRELMRAVPKLPGARLAAVCDIYDVHLERGRKLADPRAFSTARYQEILDRKDIDAVVIGSPDHWHVPMTVDACRAGKDVYVEKPLTHDPSEGQAVIDAQNEHGRIVQVGTQQRSMPQFQKAAELIAAGRLGTVHKVHLTWNRNNEGRIRRAPLGIDPNQVNWQAFLGSAPEQPFDEYRFRNWRWFWDFGGGILTDLMVHFIDVVHWHFGVDRPELATAIGGNYASRGVWQTPDTVQCLLLYPNEMQVYFEGTFSNARNGAMLEFMGTDATLYLDRGRYEMHPERGKGEYEEWVLGSGGRGRDFYENPNGEVLHLGNWLECVRSRAKPNCPAEAGARAAAAAHLGNEAFRSGQVVRAQA